MVWVWELDISLLFVTDHFATLLFYSSCRESQSSIIITYGFSSIPFLVPNRIIDKDISGSIFCIFCFTISINVIKLKVCCRIGFT